MIVLGLTDRGVGHLAAAVSMHVRKLKSEGLRAPAEVDELLAFLTHSVRERQGASGMDALVDLLEGPHVDPRLFTKADAAKALRCSRSTVDRLIRTRALRTVRPDTGGVRIRVADLDAYVAGLDDGGAAA